MFTFFKNIALLLLCIAVPSLHAAVEVQNLRCEARENPQGIDTLHPRLSWQLSSPSRGEKQSAYQILVASSADLLAQDKGDVWDSGKIGSGSAFPVSFEGLRPNSSAEYFWKVRAWDKEGQVSAWSAPSKWTMGLLKPDDWKGARWIGAKPPALPEVEASDGYSLRGFHGKPLATADAKQSVQITWADPQDLKKIVLIPMIHEGVEGFAFPVRFKIEGSATDDFKSPQVLVDQTASDFANPGGKPVEFDLKATGIKALRLTATKLAPLPKAKPGEEFAWALDEIRVLGSDGKNVAIAQKVSTTDSLERYGWGRNALTRGAHDPDYIEAVKRTKRDRVYSIRLRREFAVKPGLRRALLHVSGLGHYTLDVNGQPASDALLTPGWTNYRKTCLYDTHDVTALLKEGNNALGLTLAGGMYRVPHTDRYEKFTGSFGDLQAIGHLTLEYSDGRTETLVTDEGWQQGPSPITFNTIYAGEDKDARREQPGWSNPGFSANADWKPATILGGPGGALAGINEAGWPLKAHEVLKQVSVKELSPGVFVYDLGQNAALIPRITVRGRAGDTVKIVPSELVGPNGDINDTMCGGKSFCVYTLAGGTNETWSPHFYYRGARYLRIELNPAEKNGPPPVVEKVEGIVMHADAPVAGEFSCSNDLFNRIYTLVRWAQRSNMMHVLTDCPQREKLGWLEQLHLNGPSLRYNFDLNPLFTKITRDMIDGQTSDGLVPDVCPEYVVFKSGFRDSPEWGSAIVLVPWQQYEFTGDTGLMRESYPAMVRYLNYLRTKETRPFVISHGLGDWYDIGPKPPGQSQLTTKEATATAFYYEDALLLSKMAGLLGKKEDAATFAALAQSIAEEYLKQFFNPATAQVDKGSQCANSIALVMGLVPEDRREAVLQNVVKDVQEKGLTAGDVGYRYLLRALADGGRSDVIYALNNQSEKPGYGYQLKQGATALTEAWNAETRSSQNHFMLGQINEWFFRDLAGIQPDPNAPGFQRIIIRPSPVGDLTWVNASYEVPAGRIASFWKVEGGRFSLEVTIPPNASAEIHVPAKRAEEVLESGKPAANAEGVRFVRQDAGHALFEVGSGTYHFVSFLKH